MSWNHRILKRIHKVDGKEDNITYWVCEAVYPSSVERDPGFTMGIRPMSEDLYGLRTVLEQMLRAVDDVVSGRKTVLTHFSGDGTEDPEG